MSYACEAYKKTTRGNFIWSFVQYDFDLGKAVSCVLVQAIEIKTKEHSPYSIISPVTRSVTAE